MKYILLFIISFQISAEASQIIDVMYEGNVKYDKTVPARKAITEKAIAETTLKYIAEFIGELKINKHKKVIETNIIKQSGKYILTVKTGELVRSKEGMNMSVAMKLSLTNLKKMLLQNGLLYEIDGDPKVLPLIVIEDRVNGETYSWWVDHEYRGFLKSKMGELTGQFKDVFAHKNFYMINPIESRYFKLVPVPFRVANQRLSDSLALAEVLGAQVLLKGRVTLRTNSGFNQHNVIEMNLTAYQSANGRIIGNIKRIFETDRGSFKATINKKIADVKESLAADLVAQVLDAWQKGTFGSSVVKLTMNGNLSYQDHQFLKTKLSEIKQIRSIRERLYSPGQVVFEVDTSLFSNKIAEVIKNNDFGKYVVKIDDVEAQSIELDVTSR